MSLTPSYSHGEGVAILGSPQISTPSAQVGDVL